MQDTQEPVGVIVGRFQIDEMHLGHTELINSVRARHKTVVIFVGVAPGGPSKSNPLDFDTRQRMLNIYTNPCVIAPIIDCPSDQAWSKNLDGILKDLFPTRTFHLYGGRDSFVNRYSGDFPTTTLEISCTESSTTHRKYISERPQSDTNFRRGVIYGIHNQFPRINPTVDIALVDFNHKVVLLGRKKGRKEWCFPGGFVDINDKNFESAAKRELYEETGIIPEGKMSYISSREIGDFRSDSSSKIMTTFFLTSYSFGVPIANDDLEVVKWFYLWSAPDISKNHRPLWDDLIVKIEARWKFLLKPDALVTYYNSETGEESGAA